MQFLSFAFCILFSVCFFAYYALKGKHQNLLLLLASSIFVGYYQLSFLITAIIISLLTFFLAQWIQKAKSEKRSTILYAGGILTLVIVWIGFRYIQSTAGILHAVLPFIEKDAISQSIVFPLGISFYTFQAIGYLTDAYWGELEAERNPIDFLVFMLFFMKFLSGPIERGGDLLTQLKEERPFQYQSIVYGLKLIFIGLFKKLVIADRLAPHTDLMFGSIHHLSGLQLIMTCLIYPLELYADFSGYTDMAIGGAKMFGIDLVPNFNRPFCAQTTTDLWRRWHMSLSFWVRDYLYVPLTAWTRTWGKWGIYSSLIITFVALGIWHGAGWAFAVYGLIQGLILCWELRFRFLRDRLPRVIGQSGTSTFMIIRTYLLFAFSLLFFRLESLSDAFYYIRNMSFSVHESWKEINIGITDHYCIVIGLALLAMFVFEHYHAKNDLLKALEKQPTWLRWSIYYLLIFTLFTLGNFEADSFIYLQF